jgi:hypothetical protein
MRINRTYLRDVVQTVPKWCTRGRQAPPMVVLGSRRRNGARWRALPRRGHQSGFFIPSSFPLPEGEEMRG